jgi:hypothetical protein
MNNISQIKSFSPNTAVQEVQAKVQEVHKQRTTSSGKNVQDIVLTDGTGASIRAVCWEKKDLTELQGAEIILTAGPKGGFKTQLDDYKGKNEIYLSVSSGCPIQVVAQGSAPKPAQAPSVGVAPVPHAPAVVVNGAKVGMAINCATNFMIEGKEPFDSKRIHELASEIVRISNSMEQGDLPALSKAEDVPY